MTEDQIYSKLNEIFEEVLDLETVSLEAKTTAADIEGWDSIAHVRLIVAIEKEVGVQFETSEINDIKNVGALVDLLTFKIKT